MKIFKFVLLINLFFINSVHSQDKFDDWLKYFSQRAAKSGISNSTINNILMNAKFLPNVIKYDRYQPEFYEDTKTYISKRTSSKKVSLGKKFYEKNSRLINAVENE